ncbi:class I SAM-dependent methyltransferase [Xylocopilactobacillus apicola]|uniref:SAM-dependent methyltransferase n=1 Tax=Xylocopilactobacillus apicola TaxID=2932184 RepID=A0AAU9CWL2_9LACO|nr:class I SAM-dependent methyltransferase [Xylocopilactobacillus apicola]BDR58372.1 SAM-dependent methyltransferase [Xylocopilactobacillus apicola]
MNFTQYFESFDRLGLILPEEIQGKIKTLKMAVADLNQGMYPKNPLPYLPLVESEISELIFGNLTVNDLTAKISELDHLLIDFRTVVRENLGLYCILNEVLLNDLVNFVNGPVLELAAGNGFLAARLASHGLQVTAVDNLSYASETENLNEYLPVVNADAKSYLARHLNDFASIILAWSPDQDNFDLEILRLIRTSKPQVNFFVIGEHNGKTNSDEFWSEVHFINLKKMIRLNKRFSDFDLYHDRIYMVE